MLSLLENSDIPDKPEYVLEWIHFKPVQGGLLSGVSERLHNVSFTSEVAHSVNSQRERCKESA